MLQRACAQRHGRGCLRHDREGATTQPNVRHNTAPSPRPRSSARAVGAQLGFRVCILCTQPSLDSMHCSESLFGTLFMNTVHEHCSRGFQ